MSICCEAEYGLVLPRESDSSCLGIRDYGGNRLEVLERHIPGVNRGSCEVFDPLSHSNDPEAIDGPAKQQIGIALDRDGRVEHNLGLEKVDQLFFHTASVQDADASLLDVSDFA